MGKFSGLPPVLCLYSSTNRERTQIGRSGILQSYEAFLQQNEMFILGLSQEEFDEAIQKSDKPSLSKHLYLVWSISNNDYWFRHHLETKNSELKNIPTAKEAKRYFRFKSVGAIVGVNPIKVRLNHLGEITKIGEY